MLQAPTAAFADEETGLLQRSRGGVVCLEGHQCCQRNGIKGERVH